MFSRGKGNRAAAIMKSSANSRSTPLNGVPGRHAFLELFQVGGGFFCMSVTLRISLLVVGVKKGISLDLTKEESSGLRVLGASFAISF